MRNILILGALGFVFFGIFIKLPTHTPLEPTIKPYIGILTHPIFINSTIHPLDATSYIAGSYIK